jgi:rSAM/selenodomain-associated transferase 1
VTAIIIIAKEPIPGRAKTRLCPPCTPTKAATIAAAALADTLTTVRSTPATARILALDGRPGAWIPDGFVVIPQLGSGLDERIANAFSAITGPAVLVGMDTPQLRPALILDAVRALHAPGVDAVLGPAHDGGWWTIGLRHADPRVFVGVPMSTEHTCDDQRARLATLGLHTRMLPTLRDVDTYDDAVAVAAEIPTSRFARAVAGLGNVASATT